MALSKSAWLQRAVVFGRVRAVQRRRRSRHFHTIGVVELGVVSCIRDFGISASLLTLWALESFPCCFEATCPVEGQRSKSTASKQ